MPSDNPDLSAAVRELAEHQKKTADMLESIVYIMAADEEEDVTFREHNDYWKAVPTWLG